MIGIGTLLNTLGILVGGVAGLALRRQLPAHYQSQLKVLLGVFVVYVGLSTTWKGLNGSVFQILGQLLIVVVSMSIGKLVGRLLGIQRFVNSLGRYAKAGLEKATGPSNARVADGFVTCTVLFCVGPMAILGAVQDGLTGNFRTLAIKALMDGLATMAFVGTFGWGVLLSAIPVLAYQGTLTLLARGLAPYVTEGPLLDSFNATGGLLVFCIALIILELKKVELADYLPSLAVAPLLTWLLRG